MESSFTEIVANLNLIDAVAIGIASGLLVYFVIGKQIHNLMLLLVLSAALVGSTIPVLGTIAPLLRWMAIFLFLALGILGGRLKITSGFLFLWGYAFLGMISLFRAISFNYQIQRSVLLLVVTFIIPLVYCNKTFRFVRSSLKAIAIAASVFCLLNFVLLPGGLNNIGRFSGLSKGAASFAVFLGGLLPFAFWGLWKMRGWLRILCLAGFLTGAVTLAFTGQRTGTLGGLISIIPLFLLMQNRKTFGWALLLLIGLLGISIFLFQQSDVERNSFLLNRYSTVTDLSGRESIWNLALSEIGTNPVLGRGTGASETYFSSSFHNTYLEVWYNTGFLGLLMYIAAQMIFLFQAVRLLIIQKDGEIRPVAALAAGYMIGFMGISFFESIGASASSINFILYLFMSFLVSSRAALRKEPFRISQKPAGMKRQLEGVKL